ncbi:MAG: acyl-CoA dehydrogenase family protein [Myxococcota bacterium]
MNFGFTEEQEFLRSTAREFLQRECPMTRVRELMETERGYDPGLWEKMAELGWLGLLLPQDLGGSGLGFVDLLVLLEELGRALTPSPYLGNLLGSLALLQVGNETQRKEILPAVASGQQILTLAVTEAPGTQSPAALQARAERHAAEYRLTGTKLFVPDGQNADRFVVVARTGGEGEEGLSLLLVPRSAPGVTVRPLRGIDPTRRIAEVRFSDAPAEPLGAEGSAAGSWERIRDVGLMALAADALGGSAAALEASVAYAKQRIQFGKPIGVNQAIKHKCADMLIELESSRSITWYAAWALDAAPEEARLATAMAKAYTGDAYRHITAENIQIHGGVGFTWEYDCHLYFKRAKSDEVIFGGPSEQRERVAQMMRL